MFLQIRSEDRRYTNIMNKFYSLAQSQHIFENHRSVAVYRLQNSCLCKLLCHTKKTLTILKSPIIITTTNTLNLTYVRIRY